MKKIFLILFLAAVGTAIGLYFRPSYPVVGQLDWDRVITKGYFQSSVVGLFNQGLVDESFYYVLRYTGGGALLGLIASFFMGKSSKGNSSSSSKKKK